jgi:hypothetical protein
LLFAACHLCQVLTGEDLCRRAILTLESHLPGYRDVALVTRAPSAHGRVNASEAICSTVGRRAIFPQTDGVVGETRWSVLNQCGMRMRYGSIPDSGRSHPYESDHRAGGAVQMARHTNSQHHSAHSCQRHRSA